MPNEKKPTETKSRYSLPVRVLALVLSILVTGGALTYIIMFIMSLFS